MEKSGSTDISIRDILRPIFRQKLLALFITVIVMTSIYVAIQLRTPRFTSSVTMLVTGVMQKDVEVQRSLGPGKLIETHMVLVRSKPIMERVVRALKLYERPIDYEKKFTTLFKVKLLERRNEKLNEQVAAMTNDQRQSYFFNRAVNDLYGRVSMRPLGKTSMFTITVREFDPRIAAVIANVVSRSYLIFDLEQQIAELLLIYGEKNVTIEKLENYIKKLEDTLDGRILTDIEALGPASVKIVAQAGVGSQLRMRPSAASAYMIGILLSTFISLLFALGLDYLDNSLSSPGDVEKYLKVPFLGSIPKRRRGRNNLIKYTNPGTKYTDSYKNLSNRIYMLMKEKAVKTIIMTDAEGSKDNSAVVANLGIMASLKTGQKVLVIDADVRSGVVSQIFNISDSAGLSDVLNKRITFEDAVQDMGSGLSFLPSGKTDSNPLVILSSSEMNELIKKTEEIYDMVFIHCANIVNYSESIILAAYADSVILIVNEGVVKRHILQDAINLFVQKDINIMGVVLNNRKYVIPEILYRLT